MGEGRGDLKLILLAVLVGLIAGFISFGVAWNQFMHRSTANTGDNSGAAILILVAAFVIAFVGAGGITLVIGLAAMIGIEVMEYDDPSAGSDRFDSAIKRPPDQPATPPQPWI